MRVAVPGGDPGHLCIVGSDGAYFAAWNGDAHCESIYPIVDNADEYSSGNAYITSKLLLLTFVEQLAATTSPADVIVSCANPGGCTGTAFGSEDKSWGAFAFTMIAKVIGRRARDGARQYVLAANSRARVPRVVSQRRNNKAVSVP